MSCTSSAATRLLLSRLVFFCILFTLITTFFAVFFGLQCTEDCGFSGAFYLLCTVLGHGLLYALPAIGIILSSALWKRQRPARIQCYVGALAAWVFTILLIVDAALLNQFGFHINGLVLNLLITPGGFESMGLTSSTLLPAVVGGFLLLLGYIGLMLFCLRSSTLPAHFTRLHLRRWSLTWLTAASTALVLSMLLTGIGDFFSMRDIITRTAAMPVDTSIRMRTIMKGLGFTQPPREQLLDISTDSATGELEHYPQNSILRSESRKPNIIWLVAESLRGDFLTDEIMPQTMSFANSAWRFDNHYSGGHATRFGIFSMFYSLYGLNWDAFLSHQRPPLLMDWLQEDNYQFLALTSASFTYPEFDKTIFVQFSQQQLETMSNRIPAWERDKNLADRMIEFIKNRDKGRPFFTFAFFESTHAPYSFPDSSVIRPDYMASVNYATISAKDARQLYNRDVNAAHFLDSQIHKILQSLADDPALQQNTIVIITGDHGEEFYENGRLGHTSSFVKAQLHVPLVMKLPGVQPKIVNALTNHTDIVPTLAPFLGVQNPPEDYSVGQNLLAPDYRCNWFVSCGWQLAVLINHDYKYLLPISLRCASRKNVLTHFDDSPCTDNEISLFKQNYSEQLFKAQKALTRFVR